MRKMRISRRELFRRSGVLGSLLALPSLLPRILTASMGRRSVAAGGAQLRTGKIYQSIGVRSLVNARGTFTILSGSLMLPEVRTAMNEAARSYVHLDELADAIGRRLAVLTGAEWGMVASGCAAALTHATAACVAGGNPDLHIRIPKLAGFPRDEVVIPRQSRNVYDAAVRAVGVRVIEVATREELEAALGPRTAMIYLLAGPRLDDSELNLEDIAPLARSRGVPILVDAAAEKLTIPNIHLQRGATLVGYSGGKCLRGPQTAGVLLGRKDLVRAAWIHSAPHHGFGRAMKVGKEEAIGMLMAVEMWIKRDHDAEWTQWLSWLEHIARRVAVIDGVTTRIIQPPGLSNHAPSLRILWERGDAGLSGETVVQMLFDSEPRIALSAVGYDRTPEQTGVSVNPYMLEPGNERVVADRLYAVLSSQARGSISAPRPPLVDLTGEWIAEIEYAAGRSSHTLYLHQRGNDVTGAHQGDFVTRDLSGRLEGDVVRLRSTYSEEHGDALTFTFSGTVTGDQISGSLDMGEYLGATWTATRRAV